MKLIVKFTLSYLLVSAIVFVLGAAISYKIMADEVASEQYWELQQSFHYISERIELGIAPFG